MNGQAQSGGRNINAINWPHHIETNMTYSDGD